MDYAEAVKRLRKQRGWKRREPLANAIGYSVKAILSWEQGWRDPSRKACMRMAALAEGALAETFAQWGGQPVSPKPQKQAAQKTADALAEDVAVALETLRSGAAILAERAEAGDGAASERLKYAADYVLERAGQPDLSRLSFPEVRFYGLDAWRRGSEMRLRDQVQVPVMADAAAAGLGRIIREQDIESFVAIPARYAPKGPGKYAALHVRGDSMEPVLPDGTIVVIDVTQIDPMQLRGRIIAARVADGVVVKQLARESKRESIVLRSVNEEHGDIILATKYNPVIGVVVFWWAWPAAAGPALVGAKR